MSEIYGNALGCGNSSSSTIIVYAPEGSDVACTNGYITKNGQGKISENLFEYTRLSNTTKNGVTFDIGEDGVIVTGTPTAQWVPNRTTVELAPGTYTLSGKFTPAGGKVGVEIVRVWSDGSWETTHVYSLEPSKSVTIDGTESYVELNITTRDFTSQLFSTFVQPMLSLGPTAKDFQPYYKNEKFIFKNISYGTWGVTQEKDNSQNYEILYINEHDFYRVNLGIT